MNEPQDRTVPQVLSVAYHSGARRSLGNIAFDLQGVETVQIFDISRHFETSKGRRYKLSTRQEQGQCDSISDYAALR